MPASNSPPWYLRRSDQTVVAASIVLCLLGIGGWVVAQGGWRQMVEVDQIEPQPVAYQVDVNSADAAELMQIPGIGEVLAARIIESRTTQGPFAAPDDLNRVRGIGDKIMERIRPFVRSIPASQ